MSFRLLIDLLLLSKSFKDGHFTKREISFATLWAQYKAPLFRDGAFLKLPPCGGLT
jgi:hypothetical protein